MDNEAKLLKAEIKRLRKALFECAPSLEVLLKRRGFRIYKMEPSDDLVLPNRKFMTPFYEKMKRYSFRLFLRDVIKNQNIFTIDGITRYASKKVTSQYVDFLIESGLAETIDDGYRLKKRPIKSFGETLEWFIAAFMKKEYNAEAVWGVKFKRPKVGGDYDLIARVDSSLLYMEIKSSPPKQIYDREISAFLNRVEDLSPDLSVFFMDTELRMKDKIVPMFEAELQRRYTKTIPVERIEKELFHINKKIFIINSKNSISSNVGTALSFYWRKELNKAASNE